MSNRITVFASGIDDPKLPVVAKKVTINGHSLISADSTLMKEKITVPLSKLTGELQIIKLDNSDEALVGETRVTISDNYILVWGYRNNPFKLFDKKGNFVSAVGAYGQGPGEYLNVYDVQLDEKYDRIYLLPWQSTNILAFDLKGSYIQSIPLCERVPKGKMQVNTAEKTVALSVLPFPGIQAIVWTQDFEGNRKHFIPPGHLALPQDFSNEVLNGKNTNSLDVMYMCIMPTPRPDTLYHYDPKENELIPVFTLQMTESKDPFPWHSYMELPDYIIGDLSFPVKQDENIFTSSEPAYYMVNKRTLRGGYVEFVNDYLGNGSIYPSFSNGYYALNQEPANFISTLEKALENSKLSPAERSKLEQIKNEADPNDNNYIIFAPLK